MKKLLIVLILTGLAINSAYTQGVSVEKSKPFTDDRDGQTYQTAKYSRTFPNGQGYSFVWMTQNLNYNSDSSYCYNDSISYCKTYGRLYTWNSAVESCPQGWRLPTDEEWYMLAFLYRGNCFAGKELKSESSLWNENSQGSNGSQFDALPGGTGTEDGNYYALGRLAIFWSSEERNNDSAWDWKLRKGSELQRWHGKKTLKNAVRCIQEQ